jgi:hypothetical protein
MGYIIEVSFSIVKNSNLTELQENIKNYATTCGCSTYYEDYEFETHVSYQRKHCIITVTFNNDIENVTYFLKKIKNTKGVYIESIYDDLQNNIIYASEYYISQKMIKDYSSFFKEVMKKKIYSEDEIKLMEIFKK